MTTSLAGVSLKCKDFDRTIDYYSRIVGLKSTKYEDSLEVEINGGARMFFEQDRSLDDYRGRRLFELAKRAERLRQLEERRIRNYDPDNYVIIDEKGNRIELNDGGGEYDEDDLDDYFEDLLHIENDRAYYGVGVARPNLDDIHEFMLDKDHDVFQTQKLNFTYGASMFPDEHLDTAYPDNFIIGSDDDGFGIEIHHQNTTYSPKGKIIINVVEIDESIDFYSNVLGMKLVRKRANIINEPTQTSMSAYLTNGEEEDQTILELVYRYSTGKKVKHLPTFSKLIFYSDKIEKILDQCFTEKIPVEQKSKNCLVLQDPNGYKITVLEDEHPKT